ncbi:hypothetical protein [Acidithiobacillus thiooxidans]|uniref:hypothetical protein n=1 Tax=Acidithiobacillus thiooxidans TaxID=930 RepID=UPI0004E110DE|nr:hypothetical protein [Acidithiobacillus thiooxidans]
MIVLKADQRRLLWPVVLAGLALVSPWLGLLGLGGLWLGGELTPTVEYYLEPFSRDQFSWLGVPVFLIVALFLARHPFPTDDLLRDMTAWAWHYDYHQVFWGSPRVPAYDQYYYFDQVAGWVYRHLPHSLAPLFFQAIALIGMLWATGAMLGQSLKQNPLRWSLVALALVWMLDTPVLIRIIAGRPEIFWAVWTLAAFSMRGKRFWVWLGAGICLTPAYWLAGAYGAAFWLLPDRSVRFRFLGAILFGLWTCLFWQISSHGAWWPNFSHLGGMIQHRLYPVAEDNGLSVFLQIPALVLLPVLMVVLPWNGRRTFFSTWAALLWFCLPWMIRYVDVLFPLALKLLADGLEPEWLNRLKPEFLKRIRAVSFLFLFCVPWSLIPLNNPVLLKVPGTLAHPSRVLAPFGPKVYDTLYANPGTVRLAPAMDPGMTYKRLQFLSENFDGASCPLLLASKAQYLVTGQTLKPSPCLQLLEVNNGWALWKVGGPSLN